GAAGGRTDRGGKCLHQRCDDQHGESGSPLRRNQVERNRPVPRAGGIVELLPPGGADRSSREEKAGDPLVSLFRAANERDPVSDPFPVRKRTSFVLEGAVQSGRAVSAAEMTRC